MFDVKLLALLWILLGVNNAYASGRISFDVFDDEASISRIGMRIGGNWKMSVALPNENEK